MSKQRGFTLIEMAFVVAIIGLMVGGGLFAVGPLLLQAKTTQTNSNLDQIEAALVLFAIRNNRLPCPADGSLTSASVDYGIEVTQSAFGTSTAGQCNMAAYSAGTVINAIVPWRSLGLDETYSFDGWNNRIAYFPANPMIAGVATLVDNNTTTVSNCLTRIASTSVNPGNRSKAICDGNNATISSGQYGTYSVPTYPFSNYIAVYAINSTGCGVELTQPNTDQGSAAFSGAADSCAGVTAAAAITAGNVTFDGLRAAYVLISHGPSGYYGWTSGGTQTPPPMAQTLKAYNSNGSAGTAVNLGFVQGTPQFSSQRSSNALYFDDIVRWRSPAYIIQNCGGAACGNP